MPDYTYLRSKVAAEQDEEARRTREKYYLFVERFLQEREFLLSQLIKDCKNTIELEVARVYSMGKKEYFKKYSSYGFGIKKPNLFQSDYKLISRIMHTVQKGNNTWYSSIRIHITPELHSSQKELITTHTNWDEDKVFCDCYFPSEQHLKDFVQDMNRELVKDEIEVYIDYYQYYSATQLYFAFRANLGVL